MSAPPKAWLFASLHGYRRVWMRGDLIAGLTVHRDANGNGALDGGDPAIFATTLLQVEADGRLVAPLLAATDPPRVQPGQAIGLIAVLDLNSACVGVTPGASVRPMAGAMLPPPNRAGSLKPTVKSTITSAARRPMPMRLPKFCWR